MKSALRANEPRTAKPTTTRDVMISDTYIDFWHGKFPSLFEPRATRALFALRIIARRIHDRSNAWLRPFRLTSTKCRYLTYIYAAQGKAYSLNELSELLRTSNASVTEIISILERDGLVKCKENPQDGRSLIVQLTRKGTDLLESAYPAYQQQVADAMSALTPEECETLLELLLKVGRAFEETPTSLRKRTPQ